MRGRASYHDLRLSILSLFITHLINLIGHLAKAIMHAYYNLEYHKPNHSIIDIRDYNENTNVREKKAMN